MPLRRPNNRTRWSSFTRPHPLAKKKKADEAAAAAAAAEAAAAAALAAALAAEEKARKKAEKKGAPIAQLLPQHQAKCGRVGCIWGFGSLFSLATCVFAPPTTSPLRHAANACREA